LIVTQSVETNTTPTLQVTAHTVGVLDRNPMHVFAPSLPVRFAGYGGIAVARDRAPSFATVVVITHQYHFRQLRTSFSP
jgi:hypothetical protein